MADLSQATAATTTEDKYPIPYTYQLQYPIEWGKQSKTVISELTFTRRIKTGDLKGSSSAELSVNDMIKLIAKCTGQVTALIEEVDGKDYLELVAVIQYFLTGGQETGEKS